jgi:hypothetical protein
VSWDNGDLEVIDRTLMGIREELERVGDQLWAQTSALVSIAFAIRLAKQEEAQD